MTLLHIWWVFSGQAKAYSESKIWNFSTYLSVRQYTSLPKAIAANTQCLNEAIGMLSEK